jgi:hypothetical protein
MRRKRAREGGHTYHVYVYYGNQEIEISMICVCALSLPLFSSKFLTFRDYFSLFGINFDRTRT